MTRSFILQAILAVTVLLSASGCATTPSSPVFKGDTLISGAVAQVSEDSIRTWISELVAFHTRHSLSSQDDPEKGIGAAVRYLTERCGTWAEASEGVRPKPEIEVVRFTAGENGGRYDRVLSIPEIMVTLPGTKGDKEILLSAHIDTRVADVMDSTSFAPGANDDGSGLACLLEVVRILSRIPLEQTVKCLFVSSEEQGLDGSRFMVGKAKAEGWPIIAMINNDMIGNSEASGTGLREDHKVRLFSESTRGEDSDPRQLARYVRETAETYVPGQEVKIIYRNDRYRRSGDHTPFLREGYTAVRMSEYCENYDRTHQDIRTENGIDYGDMISGVDIPYLARNIRINLATVMNLAQAPERPAGAKIANAGKLANNTVIAWDAEPSVSYQVLYRETDQPVWQILETLPGSDSPQGSFSCPLSKDNYFFAVRSLSPAGNPSLPSVAR